MVGRRPEMRSPENLAGKGCQRQEVLTMEVTSDNDTMTDGLSELTT